MSDQEAANTYIRLCEGDTGGVVPNPAVDAFYQELVSVHPEIDDVPDEKIDDQDYCPWSIAHDRSPGHVIMSCVWSKAEYCLDLIASLAHKHGLALFDPQSETIVYPDEMAGDNTTAEDKPWWKFW